MYTPQVSFVNEQSKLIYEKKEHALIGISPFNSYFNEERIEKTIAFVQQEKFQDFHVFLADQMSVYNLLGLGYSEQEARKKSQKRDRHLRNRVLKIFDKLGVSHDHLLTFEQITSRPLYPILLEKYRNQIIQDPEILAVLDRTMDELHFEGSKNKIINKAIAQEYFLHELPILLKYNVIFELKSSLFVYSNIGFFPTYFFVEQKMQHSLQGFAAFFFK